MELLVLLMWVVVGILNLNSNKISKLSYGLTWVALLMYCFVDLIVSM